jgi:hypothetical protein
VHNDVAKPCEDDREEYSEGAPAHPALDLLINERRDRGRRLRYRRGSKGHEIRH